VKLAALLSITFVLLSIPRAVCAQEAVYVVRHAERADASADSPLSAEGEARAGRLAAWLHDAGITHIFVTDRRRTSQTAAPLAGALKLTPTVLAATDTSTLVARVQAAGPHDRLLIVGHSNTVPEVLRALGTATPITISDSEYDNLFVVVPRNGEPPVLLRLRF
jgi:phosphohistidine phosphatase SixA